MKPFTLLTILLLVPFVAADDWDDFTNNLATDLAPLIALFGERLTKQFLSESISLLDNIIFALSPLGVLTAVVSVIRVCGSSSLKAFIGRAQEGPAEAESELLPCVSQSTAELFNDGGISRVFGRPKIVEIVAWETEDPKTGERTVEFGTLRDALRKQAWSVKGSGLTSEDIDDPTHLPELDIPNLSLNKGIKRRGQPWFYCAALLGTIMQIGVIIYAAITVFIFPEDFQKDGKAVASYAFPFYIVGTSLLFAGMLFCAIIIERSSKEYYLEPNKPSKLYWLQPGNQHVGDQVFGAFMAAKQGPDSSMTQRLRYIKSTRFSKYDGQYLELYIILGSTMLGFIIQFVGLRGLHASVILAQLGSTFIMSIVRTCLRTQRMAPEENLLKDERELAVHTKQELDSFAFSLHNMASFMPILSTSPATISTTTSRSNSSNTSVVQPAKPLVRDIIRTRAFLANITSEKESRHGLNVPWDEMPVRKAAKSLAQTISATMELLSSWESDYGKEFKLDLCFECLTEGSERVSATYGQHTVRIQRRGDALKWGVDQDELESIIGLSTWSLYKSDERWKRPLNRMVGLSELEAGKLETYLYFHKWMFRQTEARLVSGDMIDFSNRMFGFQPEFQVSGNDVLVAKTDNSAETMIAQDIYIGFLQNALAHLKDLRSDAEVITDMQNNFIARHGQIDDLANCFEGSDLGSREDALLCAIPILKSLGLLPSLTANTSKLRALKELFIQQGEWEKAFKLLEWVCQRSEETEFEYSIYELGYLCRRALLVKDKSVCSIGLEYVCKLLDSDIRKEFLASRGIVGAERWSGAHPYEERHDKFTKEFGWVIWQVSVNTPSAKWTQATLQDKCLSKSLDSPGETGQHREYSSGAIKTLQERITLSDWDFTRDFNEEDDEQAFGWALQEGYYMVAYFLLVRWAEAGSNHEIFWQRAFLIVARHSSNWGILVLKQHGADIEALDRRKISALLQAIDDENLNSIKTLLDNGANPDGSEKAPDAKPLLLSSNRGLTAITKALLQYGASINITDTIGMTALHWASHENQLETVRVLLSYGADIASLSFNGVIPLYSATSNGHFEIVELLLQAGSDINFHGGDSEATPLMLAASSSFEKIMLLLLANGADIHARDINGSTALDWARDRIKPAAVRILEDALGRDSNTMLLA